jgi:hypothetical protein
VFFSIDLLFSILRNFSSLIHAQNTQISGLGVWGQPYDRPGSSPYRQPGSAKFAGVCGQVAGWWQDDLAGLLEFTWVMNNNNRKPSPIKRDYLTD